MDVYRFTDEYELVAPLYAVTPSVLENRDRRQGQPLQRWFAQEGGRALGAVLTWLRPDDRLFLMFKVNDVRAYRPLVDAVDSALGRSYSTMLEAAETDRVAALQQCGFEVEMVAERFRITFSEVLGLLERAWVPTGYEIWSITDVDERKAFELDNAIRNLVPGTDGWYGDAAWFHDELNSPEFAADAYLIAIDQATGDHVGLLRIWRNPDGPRLGLIGVLPEHRSKPLAAALLKQGLHAASGWGYDSFLTETSPSNPHTFPRMKKLKSEQLGGFVQLTRPYPALSSTSIR